MNRAFFVSLGLHATVFVLVLVGPAARPFQWDIADAIAVDLVSLPVPEARPEPAEVPPDPLPEPERVVKEVVEVEEAPPPAPEPVKPRAKPRPRRVLKRYAPRRAEDEGPSLAERLGQIVGPADSLDTSQKPQRESQKAARGPSAEVEASVEFPYAWYLGTLRNKITNSWDPPGDRMLAGHEDRILVRFRVHRNGSVTDVRLDGASRTPGLDASARRAVAKAQPFPPLPQSYSEDVLDVGVRFTVMGVGP